MKLAVSLLLCQATVFAHPFVGTWISECYEETDGYAKTRMVLSESEVRMDVGYSNDRQCSKQLAVGVVKANIQFGEVGPGGIALSDSVYTELTMVITDSSTVMMANFMGVCGISNWKLNVPRDVSGRECMGRQIPRVGERHYDLAALDSAGQLFSGLFTEELDGTTPEKRPVELDVENPFTREN